MEYCRRIDNMLNLVKRLFCNVLIMIYIFFKIIYNILNFLSLKVV